MFMMLLEPSRLTAQVDRANHTLDGAFSDLMLTALTLDVMDASILATV